MGQHRPKLYRPSPPDPHRLGWFVRWMLKKAGLLLLAILVGFVIFILVIIPFVAMVYVLLKYAAGQ